MAIAKTEKKKKVNGEVEKVKAVKTEPKTKKTASLPVQEKKIAKPIAKAKEKAPKKVVTEESPILKKFTIPSTTELLSQMREAQRSLMN